MAPFGPPLDGARGAGLAWAEPEQEKRLPEAQRLSAAQRGITSSLQLVSPVPFPEQRPSAPLTVLHVVLTGAMS